MTELHIKHNEVTVAIDTKRRNSPLVTVGDVIAACAIDPTQGLVGFPPNKPLSLRLPEGVALSVPASATHLACHFDEGAVLDKWIPLRWLAERSIGFAASSPFIIEAETIPTEVKYVTISAFNELKRQIEKFMGKAITVQYSDMSASFLSEDGFTTDARILFAPGENHLSVPEFVWPVPKNEKALENKTASLSHIRRFIVPVDTLDFLSADIAYKNLLNINLTNHWRGSPDIIVFPTAATLIARNHLALLFELKPNKLTPSNIVQACAEVAAANILFDDADIPSPVGVLTDLNDDWVLFWMEGIDNRIMRIADTQIGPSGKPCKLTRNTAVFYIQKHLGYLNQVLDPSDETEPDGDETEGFGSKLGKLKLNLGASVDNGMTDVYDEMTSEEIEEYEKKQMLLSIQNSSFMMPGNELEEDM